MLYIIGAGGHAGVVQDAARIRGLETFKITKILGSFEKEISEDDFLKNAFTLLNDDNGLICGIGSVGSMQIRQKIIARYSAFSQFFKNLIHPSSFVAVDVLLGNGVFIAQGSQIVTGTIIHDHAIINTAAVVDHDCTIGEGTHIGPGAILCGKVNCGREVLVGARSVIIQGIQIANGVILGAGTVVTRDIVEPNSTWVGAPARRIH